MKTFLTSIVMFVVFFMAFIMLMNHFASFAIVDASGKQQSVMPFTTQSTADKVALKDCGQGCEAVRFARVQ